MSLINIEKTITLDVYDHDTTPSVIKAIQMDEETRTVYAVIQNSRQDYDIGQNAEVKLTVLRPDKTKVQITGQTFSYNGAYSTMYGAKADLSDVALAVNGTCRAQFKITSGEQELRTEIFTINNGEALDAGDGDWAGDLDGHNLDEMAQDIEDTKAAVSEMETDVSELKSGLSEIEEVTVLKPTKNGDNIFAYSLVKGQWYRIKNNGTGKYNVSLRSNGTVYQFVGAILGGETAYFIADDNGDQIRFYSYKADADASIAVATGDVVDPQMLNGFFYATKYIPASTGTSTYAYNVEEGKTYRIDNKGTAIVNVTSRQDGTVKEIFGRINPNESMFITPVVSCNQLAFYMISADSNPCVIITKGEIVDTQAVASANKAKIAEVEIQATDTSAELEDAKTELTKSINAINPFDTGYVKWSYPDGFTWTENPLGDNIYTDGRGHFKVDFDVRKLISTDGLDVYVASDGSNSNDGLTKSTPKQTISSAMAINNARRIHVAGGTYPQEYITVTKDIDIIGDENDRPVFTSQKSGTVWTATRITDVYTTPHQANRTPYDLTTLINGHFRAYVLASSASDVDSNAGTYYDDGTTVRLHTFDGAVASVDTVCYTAKQFCLRIVNEGYKVLVANICAKCGGSYSGQAQVMPEGTTNARGTFYFVNCDSSHSFQTDSATSSHCFMPSYADIVFQDCTAYYSGNDGFSYHNESNVVEVNCASAFNGSDALTSCNGSTGHGGSYIRINGAYHDTHGPVCHDVGASESINLGLSAWHSTCVGKPNYCASGGAVKMWLDNCVGYSSDAGIMVGQPDVPANNAVIYKRNCSSDVADAIYGGQIVRY